MKVVALISDLFPSKQLENSLLWMSYYCCCACHPTLCSMRFNVSFSQGFSWFIDRTVLTATTGRDGKTVVKMEPWSRPVDNFTYTVDSYRPVPPSGNPVELYRPEQSWTSPYDPVQSTKPVPTVPTRHSLPSLLPFKMPWIQLK